MTGSLSRPTTAIRGDSPWDGLANRVLAGRSITRDEALAILRSPDDELDGLLAAAFRIRERYFGRKVQLYVLMNARSGLCQEDCHYCSQSAVSTAEIPRYGLRSQEEILEGAARAKAAGASTYCIVTSGRGPTDQQVDEICAVTKAIKERHVLHICVCMGILKEGQAERLKAAGVDRYNHNLNTSERFSPEIVTTHTFQDRLATIEKVKAAGISACSGAIFGMGESDEDRVDVAFALRSIGADSIPCNFLHPVPGTPFAGLALLGWRVCLRILSMMRFVNPDREIRIAGGRELQLADHQGHALYPANSLFINGYLTTTGQGEIRDRRMIQDLGFEVESAPAKGG